MEQPVGLQSRLSDRKRRLFRLLLAVGFLAVLGLQMARQAPMLDTGAPYEGWDEIATYNGARVLVGPTALWGYRYGTLDTLIQIVANQYFLLFDPLGAEYRHANYSNNNYGSLNDEFFVFHGMRPDQFGYGYFRGVDDHEPIRIARGIHFALFYLLAAMAGCLLVAISGLDAAWLLLPMLCLSVNSGVLEQAVLALPNAVNVLFSFIVTALVGVAMLLRRPGLLVVAAVALALSMNFKIDVAPLGLVLGLGLIWCGWRQGVRPMIRSGLVVFGALLFTWVATKPDLLIDPYTQWVRLSPPVAASGQGMLATFGANLPLLLDQLKIEMLPRAWQDAVPMLAVPLLLLLAAASAAFVLRRQPIALFRLAIPAAAMPLLWLAPLALAGEFYGRYALNGIGVLYAVAGLTLLALFREGGRAGRRLGLALALLLVGQYGALALNGFWLASFTAKRNSVGMWGPGNAGYADTQSRNLIEAKAVAAYLAGGYDRTVLIDQHAYLDLRPLRLAGLAPVYINIETLDTVLAGLGATAPHLVIYSPGSYATSDAWWRHWMKTWPAELAQRYDAYRARLAEWPILADTGGPPQRLLWPGPVDGKDRMVLAAAPIPSAGTAP